MNLRNTLLDIHALEQDLLDMEQKYGIRSETLYTAYIEGEEPENDELVLDFGEWASIYKTWLVRQAEYRNELHHIHKEETISPNDNFIHFDVAQPQNPSISGPRLANPEQSIYFEKEMGIV